MATDVSTALPDLTLAPGSTITVDTLDAAAVITLLNVYTVHSVTGEEIEVVAIAPLFTYGTTG